MKIMHTQVDATVKCDLCEKMFKTRGNMKSHRKTVHFKDVPEDESCEKEDSDEMSHIIKEENFDEKLDFIKEENLES